MKVKKNLVHATWICLISLFVVASVAAVLPAAPAPDADVGDHPDQLRVERSDSDTGRSGDQDDDDDNPPPPISEDEADDTTGESDCLPGGGWAKLRHGGDCV